MNKRNSPIRVGYVMHDMQVAGAQVLVKRIIERAGNTIEPAVFCLDEPGQLGEELREAGYAVVELHRKPGLDWSVAKRIASEVKSRGIEVIHAHQYTPFFYAAMARLRYRMKTRILFTEHGRHYPDVVSRKRNLANRFVFQQYADITTACCDFSTNALKQIEGFAKAITLRNGIELSAFPPRNTVESRQLREELGLRQSCPYVVCVARLHPIKDHATLIRAWEKVNQRIPDAQLLIVGDGCQRSNLEKQADRLGLRASVEFLGIRNDVKKILRAADLFTLASVSEAASLTLLEAMASGCPVAVTNVGGNAEHVREAVDGFLVPRGDHEQLAKRLVELIVDPNLRNRFSSNARQHVAESFSLEKAIAEYEHYYRALSGRSTGITKKTAPVLPSKTSAFREPKGQRATS